MISAYLAGLTVFLWLSYTLWKRWDIYRTEQAVASSEGCKPAVHLPNVWYLPGGLDKLRKVQKAEKAGRVPALMLSDHELYGHTYTQNAGGHYVILTRDSRNIKAVLKTNFQDFSIGADRQANFFPLLGVGIFTQDGHGWARSRQLLRPHFSRNQDNDLKTLEKHLERLFDRIQPSEASGISEAYHVGLQKLFFQLGVDFATERLFGKSTDSLLQDEQIRTVVKKDMDLAEAIDVSLRTLARRGRYASYYWLIGGPRFKVACETVHNFVDEYVYQTSRSAQNRSIGQNKALEEPTNASFLEGLINQTEDPRLVRDQLLNLLLASRDTTANFLAWIFYTLARNQRVVQLLRQEVVCRLGEGTRARKPVYDDLNEMTYLKWVLNETLRLYPLVPLNGRVSTRTTILPSGGGPDGESPILVPAGAIVGFSVFALHRRRDLFGEDANEFRPERWGEERAIATKEYGWDYIPFNAGPRICLGKQFALTETAYVTCRLLQQFDTITPATDPRDAVQSSDTSIAKTKIDKDNEYGLEDNVRYNIGLTMGPADGVWVRLTAKTS